MFPIPRRSPPARQLERRTALRGWPAFRRGAWTALRRWHFDEAGLLSASIAYYGLLSFLPFLLLLGHASVALVGRDPTHRRALLSTVRAFVPTFDNASWEAVQLFVEEHAAWPFASVLLLLLLASRVVHSAQVAVARILDPTHRPRASRSLLRHGLAVFIMAIVMVLLGALVVASSVAEYLARSELGLTWLRRLLDGTAVSRHVVPTLVLFLAAHLTYRNAPERRPRPAHAAWPAAVFALGAHGAGILQFAGVGALLERDLVYGSFVGVISLAVWTWVMAALLLFGAEVVAVLDDVRND